ncbi:DUF1127 domain-containing protein [Saccharospirillum alexandrii]|uniref:DUF1127 domain-containing protein n=1 Tax=Saccharospirillum alexandrii TaxID=2448477 RepID=UPI000FD7AB6E|nr:DUF1127 domain-containing protein [Saccharospirillum alexandrii]
MTQYTLNTPLACCEISSPAPFAKRLLAQFKRTAMRYKTRQSLASLPDYRLRDLGLTRDQVVREIIKPIWR